MTAAGRLGDHSKCRPHGALGPSVTASDDVFINDLGALRVGDDGTYPCQCASWTASEGAPGVYVNKRRLHRVGDDDPPGVLNDGSPDVVVGDHVAEDARGELTTWAGFRLVASERHPIVGARIKVTHAGVEHFGVTDERGQVTLDGLPIEPRELTWEVLEPYETFEVEEKKPDADELRVGGGPGAGDPYTFLGEERAAAPAPGAPPVADDPAVHYARAAAFQRRGDAKGAIASLMASAERARDAGDEAAQRKAIAALNELRRAT